MFKKLKDKIAEEVKISPQRMQQIQQFTQSVTDKLQPAGGATPDDGLFSISEDDGRQGVVDTGFTNVTLHASTPETNQHRTRRNSNSSIASDVSFLPRYEPSMNSYHLQSDLDISASEIEDNASTQSSQLGHVSKEQVHMAFQKAQMRYHKYRGRYTDLANHYKELERENAKMKAVLVETQDKAIRRASELKEQCTLSQRAKADLEAALRTEIEEKAIVIDSLKQKVDLLQLNGSHNDATNGNADAIVHELQEKLQELKANSIVAREQVATMQRERQEYEERERANNLKFAKSKMDLHTELQNRELEITNLKQDVDALRHDLDAYEGGGSLKAQNTNLIDKCEALKSKCHEYEAELVKVEQYKLEIADAHAKLADTTRSHQEEISKLQEETKHSLVALQDKIKTSMCAEYADQERQLRADFDSKLRQLDQDGDSLKQTQVRLMQAEETARTLDTALRQCEAQLSTLTDSNGHLERNYLSLMEENNSRQAEKMRLESALKDQNVQLNDTRNELDREMQLRKQVVSELELLQSENGNLKEGKRKWNVEIEELTRTNDNLQLTLQEAVNKGTEAAETCKHLQTELKERTHCVDDNEKKMKEIIENGEQLQEENDELRQRLQNHEELKLSTREVAKEHGAVKEKNEMLNSRLEGLNNKLTKLRKDNSHLNEENATLSNRITNLNERLALESEQKVENDRLTSQVAELLETCHRLENDLHSAQEKLNSDVKDSKITELMASLKEAQHLSDSLSEEHEKRISKLALKETQVVDANSRLSLLESQLHEVVESKERMVNELSDCAERLGRVDDEMSELQRRNGQLSGDNRRLMDENDSLMAEASDIKLQLATKITNTDAEVAGKLAEVTGKYSEALDEAKAANDALAEMRTQLDTLDEFKEQCAKQLADVERHCSELEQERQFLQDEIAELKTAPLNVHGSVTEAEFDALQAKLAQYKSIDQTNRASIEFYENELQKMHGKHEKLNRRLDETLVTLNHCADLSASTEVEYLKNVLYNYMLGKEGLVLARVIAAVCKFDREQTDAVLKHEQHKQTLLGQLGIL